MSKPIVAGNWKMNGSKESIDLLLRQMLSLEPPSDIAEIIIFPPSLYVHQVKEHLRQINWYVGAQDVSSFNQGAFTGELSASMLRDSGCTHVLIGHSERRHVIGESNNLVAQKYAKSLEHKLVPILCVGETLQEREAGNTETIIANQLESVLDLPNGADALSNGIIAYEPVWAIGTGLSAAAEEANVVHSFIANWCSENSVNVPPIIYGGSVTSKNAEALMSQSNIGGVLIGGASLNAEKFVEVIRCIN